MNARRHRNAPTTPKVRRKIRRSELPERELARCHGLNRATVRK